MYSCSQVISEQSLKCHPVREQVSLHIPNCFAERGGVSCRRSQRAFSRRMATSDHQFGVNDDISRQQFGERLYTLVQLQEPLLKVAQFNSIGCEILAEKITAGMLLELPLTTLEELCGDAVALSDHVTRCVDVLKKQLPP